MVFNATFINMSAISLYREKTTDLLQDPDKLYRVHLAMSGIGSVVNPTAIRSRPRRPL